MSQSGYERNLLFQIRALSLPEPQVQYRFAAPRRWTFDLAWPGRSIAVEVEGGIWIRGGGRHNRASSFEKDTEKYNEAALRGWAVLRVMTGQVKSGLAVALIERALGPSRIDSDESRSPDGDGRIAGSVGPKAGLSDRTIPTSTITASKRAVGLAGSEPADSQPAVPREARDWQPISTAPKDGSAVLGGGFGTRPEVCWWWDGNFQNPAGWLCSRRGLVYPTHWQPLPSPPVAPQEPT